MWYNVILAHDVGTVWNSVMFLGWGMIQFQDIRFKQDALLFVGMGTVPRNILRPCRVNLYLLFSQVTGPLFDLNFIVIHCWHLILQPLPCFDVPSALLSSALYLQTRQCEYYATWELGACTFSLFSPNCMEHLWNTLSISSHALPTWAFDSFDSFDPNPDSSPLRGGPWGKRVRISTSCSGTITSCSASKSNRLGHAGPWASMHV